MKISDKIANEILILTA